MAAPTKFIVAALLGIYATIMGLVWALNVSGETRAFAMRISFVIILQIVIFLGGTYVWRQCCGFAEQAFSSRTFCRLLVKGGVITLLVLAQLSYLCMYLLTGTEPHWISVVCYSALGTCIQLFLALVAFNTAQVLWKFTSSKIKVQVHHRHSNNQGSVSSLGVLLAIIYGLGISIYGLYSAWQPPTVKHVEIPVRKLPGSLDNFKIVQVSDIHLGPTTGRTRLKYVVEKVNGLNPDIVVIVGDLVDAPVKKLSLAAEPLKDLRPKLGKFFVTGNHEYHTADVDNWMSYLEQLGITVLHNSHVKIQNPTQAQDYFYVAGTDDIFADTLRYTGHGMDLEKAVGSCQPDRAIILLAHQPHAAKRALDSKYDIQVVLSGHTHGGQMFPFNIGAYFLNPFFWGLYQYKDSYVYVSPGTVFFGIPMRIGTPMEITDITLKSIL